MALNADKFCDLLAFVLRKLELFEWVEVDVELMWNLLPQSVLRGTSNGEATYYLTLMSSAVNLMKQQTSPESTLLLMVRINVWVLNSVLFLYSWKGGNGFSTRMVPKLQITSGEATSDL
jgi:hypothetical protein